MTPVLRPDPLRRPRRGAGPAARDPQPRRDRQRHGARPRPGPRLRLRYRPGQQPARPPRAQLTGGALACDLDGRLARAARSTRRCSTTCSENDPFLRRRPPKSTGLRDVRRRVPRRAAAAAHGGRDVGLMATLTEFTARSIAPGPGRFVADPARGELIVAGGGARNPALMERIEAATGPVPVRRLGGPGQSPPRPARPWASPCSPTRRPGSPHRAARRHRARGPP